MTGLVVRPTLSSIAQFIFSDVTGQNYAEFSRHTWHGQGLGVA